MDVDLKGLVVLADHQTVTDAVEICPQRLQRDIGHGLADDEYRVEGEGDVLRRHGGEVCLLLSGLASLRLGHGLAPQFRQHAVQDQEIALAAGVHHAGLFQHRVHLGGLGQGGIAHSDGVLQDPLQVRLSGGGCVHRLLGGKTRDGEYRALGGLHHRLVGGGDTLLHGGGESGGVRSLPALQGLGQASEQQGENDAGIAAGPPQQGGGRDGGRLLHSGGLALAQLRHGGADGHGHIGARVAVGHGKDVQVVDGLLLGRDDGCAVEHHPLEQCAGDLFVHLSRSSLTGSWNPRTRPRP